jgi:eukaryotic-like serine/threonine-protein kinase
MPAWAPDGSRIAFTRTEIGGGRSAIGGIYVIQPNGKSLRRLTPVPARNTSWSPDGKRLVFDDGRRIGMIDAAGSGLRYLTQPKGVDADPAWSPDGRTIAFVRYASLKSKTGDIWLMTPTGAHQRLFIRNGGQPAWKRG